MHARAHGHRAATAHGAQHITASQGPPGVGGLVCERRHGICGVTAITTQPRSVPSESGGERGDAELAYLKATSLAREVDMGASCAGDGRGRIVR
eukprot:scaffold72309_cov32-Tisochrysis_lutea.AAC.2